MCGGGGGEFLNTEANETRVWNVGWDMIFTVLILSDYHP